MDFSFVEIAVRFANIAEEQCFNHDCIWWQPTFGFHKCVRTDLQKMNQTLKLPKPKANEMSCKRIEWRLLYSHFQYFIRNYMCTISAVIAITRAGLDFLHSPHINSFIHYFILLTVFVQFPTKHTPLYAIIHAMFGWSRKWLIGRIGKVLPRAGGIEIQHPTAMAIDSRFEFVHYKICSAQRSV